MNDIRISLARGFSDSIWMIVTHSEPARGEARRENIRVMGKGYDVIVGSLESQCKPQDHSRYDYE